MKIDDLSFEISALLGKATLSFKDYSELQVGDVIVLDQQIEEGLRLRIGTVERYLATAGLFKTHKALLIDERIYPR